MHASTRYIKRHRATGDKFSWGEYIPARNIGIEVHTFKSSICGPGSSVGIATGYGLDGPRIESVNISICKTIWTFCGEPDGNNM
jgi:hypothetical protein